MAISTLDVRNSLKDIGSSIKNAVADVLQSSDFISRTIGMNNAYEEIMYIVEALGREPVSLLGKDFTFIFDHVRRNYEQGTTIPGMMYGVDTSMNGTDYSCPKFTFYKERPTIRFADPMTDPMNLLDRWIPDFRLNSTKDNNSGYYYAESHDDLTNNIDITHFYANGGTESGVYVNSVKGSATCDLIRKTNDNFKHGKYRTLVARFHTDSQDSKDLDNSTQTAISRVYGMSHGRNLLSGSDPLINGYDNPYCRVWTYHHQYKSMLEAIRPFQEYNSADGIESAIMGEHYGDGGFRTVSSKDYKFDGGSVRLDNHGVLNYDNGFVNIAPKAKIKNYFDGKEDDRDEKTVSIKRCMFSIENLAWRGINNGRGINEYDENGLSAEQKGPLGGRIMWFPPYDLKFSESTRADWNPNEFIGRGEKIFTYKNTSRSGSLSFKLLIDHPAVIDYWTERDKEDHYDGVDDIDAKESKLLRFFAGCDILKAKPQKYWYKDPVTNPEEEKKKDGEEKKPEKNDPAKEKTKPEKKRLFCFVFYPNNYSGQDDRGSKIVDPIHYLLNGIGTQKRVDIVTKDAEDFAVDMGSNFNLDGYGGYEMRNKGISVTTEPLEMNYETIKGTFADTETKDRKAQYLTYKNGGTISADYGTPTFLCLAKQVSPKSDSLGSAKGNGTGDCSPLVTKDPHPWYRKRWYYRVDKDTEDQDLLKYTNYIDTNSFSLNSKNGLANVKSLASSEFGITFTDEDSLVSLTDMYMALEKGAQDVFSGLYDDKNVKTINDIIKDETKRVKISSIKFYGHASSHNNTTDVERKKRNEELAKNRYLTFKDWLSKNKFPDINKSEYELVPGVEEGTKSGDINEIEKKFWRSSHMVVEYEISEEEPAQTTESKTQETTVGDKKVDAPVVEQKSLATPKTQTQSTTFNTNAPVAVSLADYNNLDSDIYKGKKHGGFDNVVNEMGQKLLENNQHQTPKPLLDAIDTKQGHFADTVTTVDSKTLNIIGNKKESDDPTGTVVGSTNTAITYEIKSDTVKRYDNEGEFFKMLDKNEPFLRNLISEKIRYFDPAFHSISPEGFNARLTFLNQCTRQGPTIGASDANNLTAYNLAFGRPPVCVLRIGDFYYTKIIINSLSIDYGDMQWDLNPEGIGVMPMMADIKIDFEFIGGSDLAGPIARLQNAVSFNYYANTGVYDNRAEMVEYESDKSGKEALYKPYVYPTVKPPKKRKGVVDVGDVSLSDFNGQGARDVEAGKKETISYKVDENGKRI